jgi:hypothetical protein
MAFATVRPPIPESNMPIGFVFITKKIPLGGISFYSINIISVLE